MIVEDIRKTIHKLWCDGWEYKQMGKLFHKTPCCVNKFVNGEIKGFVVNEYTDRALRTMGYELKLVPLQMSMEDIIDAGSTDN